MTEINKYNCVVCNQAYDPKERDCLGSVRGNTTRFKNTNFLLWKCAHCGTLHSLNPVDIKDIYRDYPVSLHQRLDLFARGRFKNLLKRLQNAGLKKDHKILDLGCGNGIFLQYLKEKGYNHCFGFDPYVEKFSQPLVDQKFDFVIANDVIEHVDDPRSFLKETSELLSVGGTLYIGTADAEGLDMKNLEKDLMKLHQPFHRVIFTEKTLQRIVSESLPYKIIMSYKRSYMDTLIPFVNYRFLDELNLALGHEIDLAFKPDVGKIFFRKPLLFFYAFLGYFFPSAYEPAIILRK